MSEAFVWCCKCIVISSRSAIDCIKLINEEHILSGSQDGYVVVEIYVISFNFTMLQELSDSTACFV